MPTRCSPSCLPTGRQEAPAHEANARGGDLQSGVARDDGRHQRPLARRAPLPETALTGQFRETQGKYRAFEKIEAGQGVGADRVTSWCKTLPHGALLLPHGALLLPHGAPLLPHGAQINATARPSVAPENTPPPALTHQLDDRVATLRERDDGTARVMLRFSGRCHTEKRCKITLREIRRVARCRIRHQPVRTHYPPPGPRIGPAPPGNGTGARISRVIATPLRADRSSKAMRLK